MNEIKMSIVVPVYNVEKYLRRCLDSLISQTLEEVQIILVDDGSSDDSGKICNEYAQKNNNIEVIHQENKGVGYARETGIDACQGEYIAFVDPDDWIDESMCEMLYDYATNKNAKLIIFDFNIVNGQKVKYMKGFYENEVSIKNIYLSLTPGYLWNKLFHHSLKKSMKTNVKSSQAEDLCMILTLVSELKDSDIAYFPKAFYYYFQREASLSKSNYFLESYGIEDYLKSIRYILNNHNEKYRNYVVYYCIQCMYWGINNPERFCFKANYIEFIQKEIYPYIVGNDLLKKYSRLQNDLLQKLIPARLVYCNFEQKEAEEEEKNCLESWDYYCRDYEKICLDTSNCQIEKAPECIQNAYNKKLYTFVGEYFQVQYLYQYGGIAIAKKIKINRTLGEQRLQKVFLGYVDREHLGSDLWGSLPGDKLLKMLLDTYETDDIFNDAFLPLSSRIQLVLEKEYKLIPKGKECYLMKDLVKIYSKEVLYQRNGGRNVAQYYDELDIKAEKQNKIVINEQDFYEMLQKIKEKDEIIKSSQRKILSMPKEIENINLLKSRLENAQKCAEINRQAYEAVVNSTTWKITKPIRKIVDFIKKYIR